MNKLEVLKRHFGHDHFREGQSEIIDALVSGQDALGIMPTGSGKSICYQVPALMRPGIALVVSPLISLMKDQVMALKASGIPAAYINSSLTPGQQQEAIRRAVRGMYKIIYVAPERLEVPQFQAFAAQAELSLIAVDEAHCVSQWGHDFRPSYLKIAQFISTLPQRPPVCAFTATATRQVRDDILQMLALQNPLRVSTGYNRPNLHFSSVKPTNKLGFLFEFLKGTGDQCGIIYCSTRKNVESVCDKLQLLGFSVTRYHAGLSDTERQQNQEDFRMDRARIMVATNAFGMGIDKSDVRFVVHYNMPKDLESYYQEAGRAGRDGEAAECLLLYSGQDVMTGKWMIEHDDENNDVDPAERERLKERQLERLKQMTFYATSKSCLRHFILQYFGEFDAEEHCNHCSVCDGDEFEVDSGGRRSNKRMSVHDEQKLERRIAKEARRSSTSQAVASFNAWEKALYENLRELRKLLANRSRMPAYTIFSDVTLQDMVKKRPMDLDAFLDVSGVGVSKQRIYGEAFLAVIRDGTEPNDALLYMEAPNEP
ncbi:MAG: ATP-dependent DNA helicase RecQ [Clostridiales bacterium]|nr:ATP-dependent DNA helicase RecQ [Clostridiales bacterium]